MKTGCSKDDQKAVIFLGDSTSMTVGLELESYPYHLAATPRWTSGTTFVNSSQPGFTSADAVAFFFNEGLRRYRPGAVIVYLGNCDANASELNKGVYSYWRQWWQAAKASLGMPYRALSLKNKLLRLEWNDYWDPRVEAPEPAASFEVNLGRIFFTCRLRKIPVVVVRPVANRLFPAGMGKGNFIFYSLLDATDKIADGLVIPDPRFIDARRYEERGDYCAAMHAYGKILDNPSSAFRHPEYPLIVVNNYAVCAVRAGRGEEGERLWSLLLKERSARREIVLYNLASLYWAKGRKREADSFFTQAYDADVSLYRVKSQYLQALERLAKKFSGTIHLVDMATFVDDHSFVDHCHLLPEGQRLLARLINGVLDAQGILRGDQQAGIVNALYNPELSLGNQQEFFAYYKTYAPFSQDEMQREIELLRAVPLDWLATSEAAVPGVSREMTRAFRYYLGHPCFPGVEDVFRSAPNHPADIGRFPEMYLARYLAPYFRLLESNASLMKEFLPYRGIWHGSEDQLRLLPQDVARLAASEPTIDRQYDGPRVERIIERVRDVLWAHLEKGPQVSERLRTTMFWYFRELLRWGSHSRISMRYDRRTLEHCMEALVVAAVLDEKMAQGRRREIMGLADKIAQTVGVHETWCSRLNLQGSHTDVLKGYRCALEDVRMRVVEDLSGQTNAGKDAGGDCHVC